MSNDMDNLSIEDNYAPSHINLHENSNSEGIELERNTSRDRNNAAVNSRSNIDNPLLIMDDTLREGDSGRTELENYVFHFADNNNLKDKFKLLKIGARLARDKHEALNRYDGEITEVEKKLIENEKDKQTGFWKQSKFFRATIITASLCGMIQGWTQSANNGTITGMPRDLGLCVSSKDGQVCHGNTRDLWIFGMLNAIPLLSAGLFGTILADPLQEYYLGRRGSVLVSALVTIASTIGASATHTVGQLAACRAINGIALGAKASIAPIYSAEISPEHIRGAILANWQLADAAGIFLGFLANLVIVIYVRDESKAWRILTNTVLIPTLPLLVVIYLMPESPRYLMKHGKYRQALRSFELIQTTRLLAARDLMYAHAQLDFESRLMKTKANEQGNLVDRLGNCQNETTQVQNERSMIGRHASDIDSLDLELARHREAVKDNPYVYHIGVTGYFKRLVELWKNKRCRRALLSASIAMISQQMTGVNTIAFLGTAVWENALKPNNSPQVTAIIGLLFGAATYLGGLPAYWLSDKYGRSIMLAFGLPNMAWSMFVFAFLFEMPESSKARTPMISIFTIIFTLFYAPTAGTSPFSISAEVFPLVSREVGMAVSVAVNLIGAGILVLVFPMLMHRIGITASLSIFAGLNMVAFVLVYLFVPETRRRTLEELQYTFDLPTRLHVKYRAVYIRRYFFENVWKFVRGQEVKPPAPFYRWGRSTQSRGRP